MAMNNNGYVRAVIEVDVPEWEIGERATIYFPDTMQTTGICRVIDPKLYPTNDKGQLVYDYMDTIYGD